MIWVFFQHMYASSLSSIQIQTIFFDSSILASPCGDIVYICINFNRCSTTGGSRWLFSQLSPLCGWRPDLTWPDLICFVFFVFCHRDWRRQGEGLATSRVQQSNKVVPDVDGVIGTRFLRMPHFYLSFLCLADFSALEVVSVSHSMNVSLSLIPTESAKYQAILLEITLQDEESVFLVI